MTIAVFAPPASPQAAAVVRQITAHGGRAVLCDLTQQDNGPATLAAAGVTWNGLDLTACTAIHVHGFRHEEPALVPAAAETDWSLWQTGPVVRQQRQSFLLSLFMRLEAAGVPLYNPPSCHLDAFARPVALARVRAAGVAVPSLTLTNAHGDGAALLARAAAGGLVWRPVNGRAAWQRFTARQCDDLMQPHKPPVMLAPIAPGAFLRVYVIDGRVAVAYAQRWPMVHDEGFELIEGFAPVPLTEAQTAALVLAARAAGARYACILAAVDGDAPPVVYDIDADPVMLGMPAAVADHLNAALALALLGRGEEIAALPLPAADQWHERPSLFHRRMLAIQFQIEGTKYAEP